MQSYTVLTLVYIHTCSGSSGGNLTMVIWGILLVWFLFRLFKSYMGLD